MSKARTLANTVSTGGSLETPDAIPASDISGLSTVATSGSYNDLSSKPTLSTVATSGSYNDLSNKPTTIATADDLSGGVTGAIPYQAGVGDTAMLSPGTSGQVLTSGGSGSLPTWATVSAGFTLATPLATTSGTSVEFTGIPSGIKMLVINFHNVSTNNTAAEPTIQLGDSSGYPSTSAYYGVTIAWAESSNTRRNWNTYYPVLIQSTSQTYNYSGSIILSLMNSTNYIWSMQGLLHSTTVSNVLAGSVDLAGSLSKLKLTTSYAFDDGSVNIMYM